MKVEPTVFANELDVMYKREESGMVPTMNAISLSKWTLRSFMI